MNSIHSTPQNSKATLSRRASKVARGLDVSRGAFSLVEIIITVALLSVVVSLVIPNLTSVRTSVQRTKLTTEVTKLNQIITAYVAEGGSLTGLTAAQDVLDKLKTTRNAADARGHVGTMTGRAVDTRLAARPQNSSEKRSKAPRAVWNATTLQFTVSTTAGQDGVAGFYLNDALAELSYGTEARDASKVKFNSGDGWVWAEGQAPPAARPVPNDFLLASVSPPTVFVPSAGAPPTATGSSAIRALPTPVITPPGGIFTKSSFPGSVAIRSNGAPGGGRSRLKYQIKDSTGTTGGWQDYNAPLSINHGDTVMAMNFTNDPANYRDSGSTSESYHVQRSPLPTPVITPVGGVYAQSLTPTPVTIMANGAPSNSSMLQYKLNNGPWTVYSSPLTVPSATMVTARNFSTEATLYDDSADAVESYYWLVPSFTGTVAAKWNTSDGPQSKVLAINNTDPNKITETNGRPASRNDSSNSFTFKREAGFVGIPANTSFKIGQLEYKNGTIVSGTGSTGLHLHLDITMTSPSAGTAGADIDMALTNTPNTSNAAASADICTVSNPVTNYSITLGGVTYTLKIKYGSIDVSQGFVVNENELHVLEGATGSVPILASFVSSIAP